MKATSLIHEETDGTSIQKKIQHPLFKLKKQWMLNQKVIF